MYYLKIVAALGSTDKNVVSTNVIIRGLVGCFRKTSILTSSENLVTMKSSQYVTATKVLIHGAVFVCGSYIIYEACRTKKHSHPSNRTQSETEIIEPPTA